MASIERKIDGTGKVTWQARWRDPAGAQRKRSFRARPTPSATSPESALGCSTGPTSTRGGPA